MRLKKYLKILDEEDGGGPVADGGAEVGAGTTTANVAQFQKRINFGISKKEAYKNLLKKKKKKKRELSPE